MLWVGPLGRLLLCCAVVGCTLPTPSSLETSASDTSVVFGRALTVLLAESTRRYQPHVRFFEIVNQATQERIRIDVHSDDKLFVLSLPPGEYELTRVQISEGPFLSMADLEVRFHIGSEPVTYLGTWRFGIESPRYERMIVVSAVEDQESREDAERQVLEQYPDLTGRPIATLLPVPSSSESRLHEVMPYPYYPRYYRRHWW